MFSAGDLSKEIVEEIAAGIEAGRVQSISTVVQAVVARHGEDDREFTRHCVEHYVSRLVGKQVREIKARESHGEHPAQPSLPELGPEYDLVQRSYSVRRDGEPKIVPLEQMTYDDYTSKIEELETNARGNQRHGEQLRRLRDKRFPPLAAAAE